MMSKVRTVTILLAVCAVFPAAAAIAQLADSNPPAVPVTVLTGIAAVLAAAAALGVNRGARWAWPTAVGAAVLIALFAVPAIIGGPVGVKVGAGVVLVLLIISLAILVSLRQAGRAPQV